MKGTGRHASGASARPTAAERAPRQPPPGRRRPLLGPIAGVGRPARRLSVTALAAGAVAITAIAAAVATSGSVGGATSGARLTGEVGLDNAASSAGPAWAYAAPAMISSGHAVVTRLPVEDAPLVLTAADHKDC